MAYDCYGSGQKVMQHTFGGQDWRQTPAIEEAMFAGFMVMRRLHELLMFLTEALKLQLSPGLRAGLEHELEAIEQKTLGSADVLLEVDFAACKRAVDELLLRVGEEVRAEEARR